MNPYVVTTSGRVVDLLCPEPKTICLGDIAYSLARQQRYNAHGASYYSVAEHSVIVAQDVSREHRAAALLHDAAEAYIGDIVTPLKVALLRERFETHLALRNIEARLTRAIAVACGVSIADFDATEIRCADQRIIAHEVAALFPHVDPELFGAPSPAEPMSEAIRLYPAESAEEWFLTTAAELGMSPRGQRRVQP